MPRQISKTSRKASTPNEGAKADPLADLNTEPAEENVDFSEVDEKPAEEVVEKPVIVGENSPGGVDPDLLAVQDLVNRGGLSFAEAVDLVNRRKGRATTPPTGEPITNAALAEPVHRNPPPKAEPDRTFEVTLKSRHADWLERMAYYESLIRREKNYSPSRYLELLVREAYAADPTKGGQRELGGTGKAGDFNPVTGQWDR